MASWGVKSPTASTASLQLPPLVHNADVGEAPEWRNGASGRGGSRQDSGASSNGRGAGRAQVPGVFDRPYRRAVEGSQNRGGNEEAPIGPRLPTSWTIELDAASAWTLGLQSDARSNGKTRSHVISMSQAPEKIIQALQIQAAYLTRRNWQLVRLRDARPLLPRASPGHAEGVRP